MFRTKVVRRILSSSAIAGTCFSLPAMAQTAAPALPDKLLTDENGIDLSSREFLTPGESLMIGDNSSNGLVFQRLWRDGWHNNLEYSLIAYSTTTSGVTYGGAKVTLGLRTLSFTDTGSGLTEDSGEGDTITISGTNYLVTLKDGTVITFDSTVTCTSCTGYSPGSINAIARSLKRPSGQITTFHYTTFNLNNFGSTSRYDRLKSVSNSNGYEIRLSYVSDTPPAFYLGAEPPDYQKISKVSTVNLATSYCDTEADTCSSIPTYFPSLTYNYGTATTEPVTPTGATSTWTDTVTDNLNRTTSYVFEGYYANYGNNERISAVQRPGDATASTIVAYDSYASTVTSITRDGVLYTYSNTDQYTTTGSGDPVLTGRIVTRTNASTGTRTYKVDFTLGLTRITSFKDELLRERTYGYDAKARLTSSRDPEGGGWNYIYDPRGNVTSKTRVAKPGSGLTNTSITAVYPTTCTNTLTCNQPTSVTDARGNTVDYTYDTNSGLVLTETDAAPTAGAVRPQTRYAYTPLQAYYKNAAGAIVASGTPTYELTSVSTCRTIASCAGTVDETKTSYSYGSPGVANNLARTSSTVAAGDNSVSSTTTSTFDDVGNLVAVDGPLSGTADTTTYRYDADREKIGTISPDPDDSGPLHRRALRVSYNANGQPLTIDVGTTNGTSDADWAAFSQRQQAKATYDGYGRPTSQSLSGAGTTYQLTQYSYDAAGRLDCSAVRMNATQFASLPASACTAQTPGSTGPDRIKKMTYDAAGENTKVTLAYGTSDQSDDKSTTFTPDGNVATVTDANGNTTAYSYDGFDRQFKTNYPSTTKGSGSSSTTDYEQVSYDANDNILTRRRRDGASIGYTYDNLNRLISKDLPSPEQDVTYRYDLLGNMTNISNVSTTITRSYDSLSRLTSEAEPFGTMSYQYDPAGRRTRVTWWDGFYVTYDYLTTGDLVTVKENGVSALSTFAYDDSAHVTAATRSNGTSTIYGYDNIERLSSLGIDLSGTANDQTLGFSYNPASQIISNTRSNGSYSWTGSVNVSRSYSTNGLNQYGSAGSTTFSYDGRGNLSSSGSDTYAYSVENLLKSKSGGISLYYDGLNRLTEYDTTASTRFVYDGGQIVAEVANPSGSILRRYVPGLAEDRPLIWYEGAGSSDKRWLVADEHGSIVSVTDASGAAIATNTYDEYGIPGAGNIGRFQYTGQAWLPELGLYYYKARMYSPSLGRFMQTDPIWYGDGINWYNYVGSDPINGSDSTGTDQNFLDIGPGAAVVTEVDDIQVTGIRLRMQTSTFNLFTPAAPGSVSEPVTIGQPDIVVSATRRTSSKKLRKMWEDRYGKKWPIDPDTGRNQDAHHKTPLSEGGGDNPENIEPKTRKAHIEHHKANGDFRRWGARGAQARNAPAGEPAAGGAGAEGAAAEGAEAAEAATEGEGIVGILETILEIGGLLIL